ncbi:MAG: carbonic anhydrase/acetyltransferase-like protein (isoleucine patch superfamily) [Gammaproteobacteria bacterium]|jgi:carbonic anhydrase/acetyltransferase-like protein (isoleucine patch superfamily)
MTIFGADVDLWAATYVHPSAQIHGKVSGQSGCSIWANAVIRAESFEVVLGEHCNVQDFAMIHIGYHSGTYIGAYTSLAHNCTVHGARVGDNCLIGIGATIMDDSVIGNNTIVGSGALVLEGTQIPENSVVVGSPARVIKTTNNWVANRLNALLYSRNAQAYQRENYRAWHGPEFDDFLVRETARLEREFAAQTNQ